MGGFQCAVMRIIIVCDIGGGDGSITSVQVSKNSKRFTSTKFVDVMFKSGHIYFLDTY